MSNYSPLAEPGNSQLDKANCVCAEATSGQSLAVYMAERRAHSTEIDSMSGPRLQGAEKASTLLAPSG